MPFITMTGEKRERKIAGYMPPRIPTRSMIPRRLRIIMGRPRNSSEKSLPDKVFNWVRRRIIRPMLRIREKKVSRDDSARNWVISSRLLDPMTFRKLISLALLANLAVAM
jgi:hypothetical protein